VARLIRTHFTSSFIIWIIEDSEREALSDHAVNQFRARVVQHCYEKAQLEPPLPRDQFEVIGNALFDRTHAFLKDHPSASYDSYVLMVLLYFIRGIEAMEGPDLQTTLRNSRIAINTRVRVVYDVTLYLIKKGY
jgi:hypothetical protein